MAAFSEDFREEIRIAQFWRKLLGDEGYNRFHPAELRRWYQDMQRIGVDGVERLVRDRGERVPMSTVLGISYFDPHPTRALVDLWVENHRESRFSPLSVAVLAAVVMLPLIVVLSTLSRMDNILRYQAPGLPMGISPPVVMQPPPPQIQTMLADPDAPQVNNAGAVPPPPAPPPVIATYPTVGIGAPNYPIGTSAMSTPASGSQFTGVQVTGAPGVGTGH